MCLSIAVPELFRSTVLTAFDGFTKCTTAAITWRSESLLVLRWLWHAYESSMLSLSDRYFGLKCPFGGWVSIYTCLCGLTRVQACPSLLPYEQISCNLSSGRVLANWLCRRCIRSRASCTFTVSISVIGRILARVEYFRTLNVHVNVHM